MKLKFLSIIMLFFAFASCKDSGKTSTKEKMLEPGKYEILNLNENSVESFKMFFNFNIEEQRVSGFAGCNNFNGKFTVEENKLNFSNVASTRKFCKESASQESEFLKALNKVQTYAFEGELLLLKSAEGKVLMEAKKAKHIE